MSMRPFLNIIMTALLAFSGSSCKSEQVFQVNGIVKEVLPERRRVKIEHEKIPNYMAAMTMTFDVKNAKELAGVEPGDKVSFRMIVTEKDGWIDHIKKTGTTTPVAASVPEGLHPIREVDPLKVGELIHTYY